MKTYKYKIDGAAYDVTINEVQGRRAKVVVNGIPFDVEMQGTQLTEDNLPNVDTTAVSEAPAAALAEQPAAAASAPSASEAGKGNPVKAPLPGVVTKVLVKAGQAVKKGENILVLEAMKMENNITAESDGTVTAVCVNPGDSVLEGTVLLTID
jgi:methylmalonyl-coA decarboxylase, gamma subunit